MRKDDLMIFIVSLASIWMMLEFLTFLAYGGLFLLSGVTALISLVASAQITMLWIAQHIPSKSENLRLRNDLRLLKLNILNANYSRLNPYPHFFP